MNSIRSLYGLLFILISFSAQAQSLSKEKIYALSKEKFPKAIESYNAFLELPNDGHYPDQIEDNLIHCQKIFSDLKFELKRIETTGAPLLFAQKIVRKSAKTVLFYMQIDGQPVDTLAWDQPNPFKPVLKEKQNNSWQIIDMNLLQEQFNPDWRIFARSSSDSKGPAMSLIAALQILQEQHIKQAYNIKVIMDFQEEMGSPTLPKAVLDNKDLLSADMLFIMDGTRHVSNLPTLTYGARGIATATIKFFGPIEPLHSGQYGNYAPNPVFQATKLLGGLKNDQGKVTLPGFYGGINLSNEDKEILQRTLENKDSLMARLGISIPDAIGESYEESLQYPSLNIRGLSSGWVGKEVRTIIPSEVTAEIDMRLVPESDGKKLMESLKTYIEENGYHLVDSIPTAEERIKYPKLASFTFKLGSLPFRTEMNSEIGNLLNKAMKKVFGDAVVNMRTTGGSQPMSPFITTLNIPAVSVRIPNPDNNIHSPNENLRVGNFLEGIITCLAILNEPIK